MHDFDAGKGAYCCRLCRPGTRLVAVQHLAALAEGVDDVEGGDGLALRVLGVCSRVADDALDEGLERLAHLLVQLARDALHTAAASEAANGALGDATHILLQHLLLALVGALGFSALLSLGHLLVWSLGLERKRGQI